MALESREEKQTAAARKAAMAALAQASADELERLWQRGRPAPRGRSGARSRDRPGHAARPHRRRRRAVQFRRGDGDPRHRPAARRRGRPCLCARPRQAQGAACGDRRRAVAGPGASAPTSRPRSLAPLRDAAADGRRADGAPRRRRPRSTSSPWCGEKTDGTAAERIDGGFADPVFDAQIGVPRRDGRHGAARHVQPLRAVAAPPAPLSPTAGGRRADAVRPRHAGLARSGACRPRPRSAPGSASTPARRSREHAGRGAFRAWCRARPS